MIFKYEILLEEETEQRADRIMRFIKENNYPIVAYERKSPEKSVKEKEGTLE